MVKGRPRKRPRPHRVNPTDPRYSNGVKATGYPRGSGMGQQSRPHTENLVLKESEIKKILSDLRRGKINYSDLSFPEGGFRISSAQFQKGITFLNKKWKTSTGKERSNSPFGYREQRVIENASEMRLVDFYRSSRQGWTPYYRISSDKEMFEYYVDGGQVHIMN